MKQPNLVLVRHGESLWNKKNIFTGWVDIGLSSRGEKESIKAGLLLKKRGFIFDRAYTSVLKRSIKTLWLILEQIDQMALPVALSWRLNERHYGGLQGENKKQIENKFGTEQFTAWRRSYSTRPPKASAKNRIGEITARECGLKPGQMPKHESLQDTFKRVLPFWRAEIAPALERGEKVLIAAHGNSLRALVKYLDHISDKNIVNFEIPTGVPLCYTIKKGKAIKHFFLSK